MRPDFMVWKLEDKLISSGIRDLKKKERKIQAHFIAYLSEVDKRQLYAIEGYTSLTQFMMKELGYSEHSAWKRIQIARKAQTVPVSTGLYSMGRPR